MSTTNPEADPYDFNCELRKAAEGPFETDSFRPGTSEAVVNVWRTLLGIRDQDDDGRYSSAAGLWLETIRSYTAHNSLFIAGRLIPFSGEIDDIDWQQSSPYDIDIIVRIQWEPLLQAIRERRFAVDTTAEPEHYAYRVGERATLIGTLLFSNDPTPEGFIRADAEL